MEPTGAMTKDMQDAEPVIAASDAELPSDSSWPHKQLSTPLGYSADELLLPPPEEQVRVPPMEPLVGAPESPPSEQETSTVNQWAKILADTIDPPEVSAALHARDIVGRTCKEVCLQCHLDMQVDPHKMTCACFADCLRGADGASCPQSPPRGWSNSDRRTRPVEEWRAACGGGDRNCTSDCLSAQLLGALGRCDSQEPRAECVLKVKDLYERSSPDLLYDGKSYCSQPLIKTCQEFHTIPQGDIDITGAGRWTCFSTLEACEQEKLESTNPQQFDDVREPPSVWKSVSPKIVPFHQGRFA
jgi:hypothetical protein